MNKNKRMIKEEWFNNHEVLLHDLMGYKRGAQPTEILIWGEPGTIHMKILYVLIQNHGVLMVYGDLGEAVYRWYGRTTLKWISTVSIDYFHGKCCASELGRSHLNYDWSPKEAKKSIFEYFKDNRDCKGYKEYKESQFYTSICTKEEWHAALHAYDPMIIFGQDWWEWVPSVGNIIPMRCRAHLIGLNMAFNIKNKKIIPVKPYKRKPGETKIPVKRHKK